jgi:DegV family protein with EDD domain
MIKIVGDTTSTISLEEAQTLDIAYIPQIIHFGEQSYQDAYELDMPTFLAKFRSSKVAPKTAAPPPPLYYPVYEEFGGPGNTIFIIAPSIELSGTVRSAQSAAEQFPQADIRIIDTRTVGAPLGSIVRQAVKWAQQGMDADTLEQNVREMMTRQRFYAVLPTLEYLRRGGRLGNAQALAGSVLQIKPILAVSNGIVDSYEVQRTWKRAVERLKNIVVEQCPRSEDACLTIQHGDSLEQARAFGEDVRKRLGLAKVDITDIPPVMLVYTGPGIIGPSFFVAEGSAPQPGQAAS